MIPIGDDNTYRFRTPYITWLLIAINIGMFVFFQGFGTDVETTMAYSMVPQEILTGRDIVTAPKVVVDRWRGERYTIPGLAPTPVPVYLTILISMFMHGGIAHIAGNLLFLSIFGDNVEDRLGHIRYLIFYLVSGVVAAAAHILVCVLTQDALLTPTLGASGAISGIMGAYLVLFPGNRVRVLLFNFIPTTVSAVVVIGMWFIFQLINGLGYLGGMEGDGVAYAAHIGGFLYGFFRIRKYLPKRRRPVIYYY
ncbi:MAG: rhomboid family intramembrane serine protease [Treponemataceae bacterium]|uniref:rhomboid family intramembrane serine protease n=1 Tax=Treponema sp. J25 TaxID=2094121 RepID=UPI0010477137|nr:rhomboid family intramembrane serine protease [Treponema sp. J25]MCX7949921.1 rhomboid family intramembrane serine protease [Treponemataceae bacterium]TCW61894.1 rhomboid family intramembrane serine protease [Treponema sp. J25]